MRFSLLISAIVSLALLHIVDSEEGSIDQDPIYKKLFADATEGNLLDSSETSKLLQQLNKKYLGEASESFSYLIDVRYSLDENCNTAFFERLFETIGNYKGKGNIVEFLNDRWMKQARFCVNSLHGDLEKIAEKLDEDGTKNIRSLRDYVLAASKENYSLGILKSIKDEFVRDGIYALMKQRLDDFGKLRSGSKQNKRAKFVSEFEKVLGNDCSKVKVDLEDKKDVFEMFCDLMNEDQINLFESVWLCNRIVENRGYFHAFVYDRFRNPSNPVSSLIQRFRSNFT